MADGTDAEASQDLFFRQTVLRYAQARRFVRRDWLAQEVTAALAHPSCRMLLLTGQPGVGKSGLVAQLAEENPDWLVYFIRRDQRSPMSAANARAVLLRIGFQLSVLRPELFAADRVRVVVEQRIGEVVRDGSAVAAEVGRILSSPFHQTVIHIQQEVARNHGAVTGLRVREWVADPRLLNLDDLATMALLDPAAALRRVDPDARIVVMLDALDEVPYQPEEETLLPWLAAAELPDNVRFILTSRPEPLLGTLRDRQGDRLFQLAISGGDERVRGDLTDYARQLVTGPDVAAALASLGVASEAFVGRAAAKADGNIGYLDALGRAVDQAIADLATAETGSDEESLRASQATLADMLALDRLPDGLDDLYAFFLRQLRTGPGTRLIRIDDPDTGASDRAEAWTELYHPMLEVLSVALEPLTAAQLSRLTGTLAADADTVAALHRLSQFLDQTGNQYRLYHATLGEFLHAERTRQNPGTADLAVDALTAHRRLAARLRADLWTDIPDQPAEQGRREYGRRNYIAHLFHARLWDELFAVLDDGSHGWHRVAADPSTREFWVELEFGLKASSRKTDEETAIGLLPRLWRYATLRHGLAQNADDQSADALATRVLLGRREQAAGLAELISDPQRRATTCRQVAALLYECDGTAEDAARFVGLARQAVTEIVDSAEQAKNLSELLVDRIALSDAGVPAGVEELTALENLVHAVTDPVQRTARLAELARLLVRDGKESDLDRVLDEIGDVTPPAEEDIDTLLLVLVETYADCGATEAAGEALDAIEDLWHLIAAGAALAVYEDAAELWPSLPERMDEVEDFAGQIPEEMRCPALARLAYVWRQLGKDSRALACLRSAVETYGTLAEPDIEVTATLITELGAAGADDLRTAIVSQTTEAALDSIHYAPGPSYTFNTKAQNTARMLASVGEPGAALRVASRLYSTDRPAALEPVVLTFAAARLWDEATAVIAQIEDDLQSDPASVDFGAGPLLDGASQADRGWYWFAAGLAEDGQQKRALNAAHRIQYAITRCAALGVIARCYALADQPYASVAVLTDHDRDLRLNAAQSGRHIAIPAAIRLLVAAKAWPAAMTMLGTIRDGMGAFAWGQIETLADGLLADGHRELAREVIDELEPEHRVKWLIRWAEDADSDVRTVTLAEAERIAEQIDDPLMQVSALDYILRACVDREPERAANLLRRAIAILNPIERLRCRPTPWTTMAADLVLVGDPAAALDLAGRLPSDDAAIALCKISETAQQTDAGLNLAQILDSAARIAAATDSSISDMVTARVAVEYARIGILDRAIAIAATNARATRAITAFLARSGHVEDALRILGDDLGQNEHNTDTEQAIVTALLAAGDYAEAERVARTVRQPGPQAGLLAQTARALAPQDVAQQLATEALRLLPHMNEFDGEWIEEVAAALTETGQLGTLLEAIHQEWLRADRLDVLATRLGLASPLVRAHAEVATGLAGSFEWVDNFFGLLGAPEPLP
ncbi:MAG: hypothetical protein M3460_25075 [Actinomycetota bacterium]|nr:hypothetical protein [Actinomycetota bacterium]